MAEKGELMILIAVSQINTILAIAARKFGAGLMQCSTGIAKVKGSPPVQASLSLLLSSTHNCEDHLYFRAKESQKSEQKYLSIQ